MPRSEPAPWDRGTTSFWMDTEPAAQLQPLHAHVEADVCVIGSGIAGLTTAYFLARARQSVVVIDSGVGGETGRTTAHLTCALDDRFVELERLHGAQGARLAATSHSCAIDLIETIVRQEEIHCEFERLDAYLFGAPGTTHEELREELAAAQRAGLADAHSVLRAPVAGETGLALCFPRQAQLHPLRYVNGLRQATGRLGGRFYKARAADFGGSGQREVRTTSGFRITCNSVVVATNTPVNDRFAIHTKQAAYRTYVIGAPVPRGSVHRALFWDTGQPYHYARLTSTADPDCDVLLVGGEDHKTGQADDGEERFARLEAWSRDHFPQMGDVRWRWSGQIMEPVDALAFIGRNPGDDDGVFVVTGDSGNGMTHGTLGGRLVAEQILGIASEWDSLYDPKRKSLRAAATFAREALNAAAQYGALLSPGEVHSRDEIPAGTGALLREGLHKLAICRDNQGMLHEVSAFCTHLGCVVKWNSTERSWDCPCHGSRFAIDGQVLHGPAIDPLTRTESVMVPEPRSAPGAQPLATGPLRTIADPGSGV
ncbi:MAG: FAD-dependent oxidoreductase [Gemmatimonadaceae bacterium]